MSSTTRAVNSQRTAAGEMHAVDTASTFVRKGHAINIHTEVKKLQFTDIYTLYYQEDTSKCKKMWVF